MNHFPYQGGGSEGPARWVVYQIAARLAPALKHSLMNASRLSLTRKGPSHHGGGQYLLSQDCGFILFVCLLLVPDLDSHTRPRGGGGKIALG